VGGDQPLERRRDPEQLKRLAALADRLGDQDVSDRDTLTDEDIAKLLGSDADDDKDTSDDKEPVAALSKEAQEKIDMAQKDAREARSEARDAADKVAAAEWKNTRREFAEKGVPPSMLDLAEPHLSKASSVIELSKADSTASSMLKMLKEAVGTIDFAERGSSSPEAEDNEKQARDEATDDSKWGVASG
jgi:ParB-like chromosome segregation protein Spo0J